MTDNVVSAETYTEWTKIGSLKEKTYRENAEGALFYCKKDSEKL